tara:strand:+ start:611 stop:1147 length:537 start_codon:yes stop_codon:yes gene_type:complete
MKEIWKQSTIVDTLEVSNLGRVRNSFKNPPRCYKGGEIRYQTLNKSGYLYINYIKSGKKFSVKIHRIVAVEFCEGYVDSLVIDHLDGDKANNICTNLEWVTQKENMQRAWSGGFIPSPIGELNGRAVLTSDLVHKICKDYEAGTQPKVVIDKYDITRNQAIKIKSRLTWKHITTQYKY